MFEAKIVIEIKLWFTGNGLWPVSTEVELQIDQKTILINDEAQKQKYVFENKYFQKL